MMHTLDILKIVALHYHIICLLIFKYMYYHQLLEKRSHLVIVACYIKKLIVRV